MSSAAGQPGKGSSSGSIGWQRVLWHWKTWGGWALAGVFVAGLTAAAVGWWSEVVEWCNAFGNVASVLGLAVSVFGFVFTIVTILETKRIAKKAQEEIQAATVQAAATIEEVQSKGKQAIERIGLHLLVVQLGHLGRMVGAARAAATDLAWSRASLYCQEARELVHPILGNPHLAQGEASLLGRAIESLRRIQVYIENTCQGEVAPGASSPRLSTQKVKDLDDMTRDLGRVQARVQKLHLEADHGKP